MRVTLTRLVPAAVPGVFLLLLLTAPEIPAQSRPTRTVLTVHWSSEDFPSTPLIEAGIRQVLLANATGPVDYFAEYLESDRFPAQEASLALRDYIKRKFHRAAPSTSSWRSPILRWSSCWSTARSCFPRRRS